MVSPASGTEAAFSKTWWPFSGKDNKRDKGQKPETERELKIESPSILTDQSLIRHLHELQDQQSGESRGVEAIATDSFIDKSKNQYNAAWLAREIVQNFVDHNASHPGTLEGVQIKSETKAGNKRRFTITGNWPFSDPTGLLSPHSEKPVDRQSAGGNGIGIKQAAIRLMRDFGADKFEIQGERWKVNYRMQTAEDANQKLENIYEQKKQSPMGAIRHDWLIGSMEKSENTGTNSYVIETDDPELIASLETLDQIGASPENEFLKDPDFKNAQGTIKWLPAEYIGQGMNAKPVEGRLFINGQVMNFKDQGDSSENYWQGPEFMSLSLNNVKYDMSIDRPPIKPYELSRYVDKLLSSMSKEELIGQLKASEHIWSQVFDGGSYNQDRAGAFVLIESITKKMAYYPNNFSPDEYQEHFGDKKYLARERGLSQDAIAELKKKGYVLCPSYFEALGMPKARTKLEQVSAAALEKPDASMARAQESRIADEYGKRVYYEDLENIDNPTALLNELKIRLNQVQTNWQEVGDNKFRINLDLDLDEELLIKNLARAKTPPEQALKFIRGFITKGSEQKIFPDNSVILAQGSYIATFEVAKSYQGQYRETDLYTRRVEASSDQGVFLEFQLTPEVAEIFRAIYITPEPESKERRAQPSSESIMTQGSPEPTAPRPESEDIQRIKNEMASIPVEHAPAPEDGRNRRVVDVETRLAPEEERRIRSMEEKIPEIRKAVATLEAQIPERGAEKKASPNNPFEQYLKWRKSEDFYGEAGKDAGYLTGKHLLEIIDEAGQADIAVVNETRKTSAVEKEFNKLNNRLKTIINRLSPEEEKVESDFELVLTPEKKIKAQIGLLRNYLRLASGADFPNDVFIYRGSGFKGINLGQKAIGLHDTLFEPGVDFSETLSVAAHELAHNQSMKHDHEFMVTMEAIFSRIHARTQEINRKLRKGEPLSDEEKILSEAIDAWENLRDSE